MDDLRGAIVGDRYTIEREIGRGGMATVWLAHDSKETRVVAIKTLHPDLAGAIATDRFLREVRLTAKLRHANIVEILDSGALTRPDGTREPWFAMPYLEGESLRARLSREKQLPIPEALRITTAVGNALAAAHREHIIHRDIKPENIFLAGDRVCVVDFGIAKALGSEGEHLTSTGLTLGTPAYMSPEQSAAEAVDERTDQYSLATVLYEMLVGEPPFTGPTMQAIISRRLSEPARSLTTVRSTVPPPVEQATLRALERTPADRFPDIDAFLAALSATDSPPARPRVRRRASRSVALGALVGLATIGSIAWYNVSRATPRPHVIDPALVTLHQRAVRAYAQRTPAGLAEAVSILRNVLQRDSLYAEAWGTLAKSYARADLRLYPVPGMTRDSLLSAAVYAIDRSLELDSTSGDAWLTQGVVAFQIDPVNLAPAGRSVARAIQFDSSRAEAWHYLARYRAETGNMTTALDAWREAVRRDPRYAEGAAFVTLAHYWRRNFDSAAFWADSVVSLDPKYVLGYANRGFVAIERGQFDRAEASFEAALRVSTDIERVHWLAGLALAQARANRRTDARITVQRAESLLATYEPGPPHPPIYIAQVYAALGEPGRAIELLQQFKPRAHGHFQLHLRCDPPFAPLAQNPRFRALLVVPAATPGSVC